VGQFSTGQVNNRLQWSSHCLTVWVLTSSSLETEEDKWIALGMLAVGISNS
jgi:hypothetical protein